MVRRGGSAARRGRRRRRRRPGWAEGAGPGSRRRRRAGPARSVTRTESARAAWQESTSACQTGGVVARWDGDERGRGVASADGEVVELERLRAAMALPDWVAEEPDLHLLPHVE